MANADDTPLGPHSIGVVKRGIVRADPAAVERLARFGVATIHEALGRAGLMKSFKARGAIGIVIDGGVRDAAERLVDGRHAEAREFFHCRRVGADDAAFDHADAVRAEWGVVCVRHGVFRCCVRVRFQRPRALSAASRRG